MTSADSVKPFNQKIRIAVLRGVSLVALPAILLTRSGWKDGSLTYELLENAGVMLIIAAVLGRFWAILYIGAIKNRTVMAEGPYSVCRHPLYFFSTVGVVGLGMMLGSVVLTVLMGGATWLILSATAAREERFLRQEFGPSYDDYARRVPRMLPRPSLYHSPATVTASTRALRGNFADALVFLSFIPFAEIVEAVRAANLLPTFVIY